MKKSACATPHLISACSWKLFYFVLIDAVAATTGLCVHSAQRTRSKTHVATTIRRRTSVQRARKARHATLTVLTTRSSAGSSRTALRASLARSAVSSTTFQMYVHLLLVMMRLELIDEACVDPEVQYCCLDGVHCQHSVCGEPGVTHPADAECCSGARGLFCPRGAYTAQDKYCSLSANIPTCQAHTRKDSCADCVNGLECCQASTGEFFGCYDPYVTTCCAIDGSHCPNFAPFPCSSEV